MDRSIVNGDRVPNGRRMESLAYDNTRPRPATARPTHAIAAQTDFQHEVTHMQHGDQDEGEEGDDDDDDDDEDEEEEENTLEIEDGLIPDGDETILDEDVDIEGLDGEGAVDEVPMEIDRDFETAGLREIGNLASWTVSTFKPGCGVDALRDDDTNLFWQSDGPQPHHLNIHFSRLVSILSIRLFLDFEADESYTPTRITLLAGTGYHDLLPFSTLEFTHPKGWIDVPLHGVGGGESGNELRAFLVQVKIVENHQNGKDTHLRGLRIYARDEKHVGKGLKDWGADEAEDLRGFRRLEERNDLDDARGEGMLDEPDWMGEPELR